MTDRMKNILERVLSQEIAKQEIWSKEDVELFGEHMNRNGIINEIKQFMKDEDIRFNQEWYIRGQEEA